VADTRGVATNFALGAAIQFISYFNLTLNFRAIAHEQIMFAVVTDTMAVVLSYTIIKRVAKDDTWSTLLGMMLGGGAAAAAGIYLTRHWG
jgi:hypothetical protein